MKKRSLRIKIKNSKILFDRLIKHLNSKKSPILKSYSQIILEILLERMLIQLKTRVFNRYHHLCRLYHFCRLYRPYRYRLCHHHPDLQNYLNHQNLQMHR